MDWGGQTANNAEEQSNNHQTRFLLAEGSDELDQSPQPVSLLLCICGLLNLIRSNKHPRALGGRSRLIYILLDTAMASFVGAVGRQFTLNLGPSFANFELVRQYRLPFIELLSTDEIEVGTSHPEQLLMVTLLHNSALRHDNDLISVPDGGYAVGDSDGCAPFTCLVQCGLNNAFRLGVERRRGLVKQQDYRRTGQSS